MSDVFSNAESRAALGSIKYNASNYQVFSFGISITFLLGIAVLGGTFVAIQSEDQNMSENTLMIIIILDAAVVAALFLAYISYLRNIGSYIYGRMQPFGFNRPSSCQSS